MSEAATQEPETPAATDPPSPKTKNEVALTAYVILVSTDGGSTWREANTHNAQSREQAVAKEFTRPEDVPTPEPGTKNALFQAIPLRSWKALKATPPEPRPPLVISEAD